ncbi:MAG TPA: hypothetical protein VGL22_05010 [Terracidiphilus sp.]|jgi:hypothetical protein
MSTTEQNLSLREGKPVPPRRLWFGTVSAAIAWVLLGCADLVITWRACMVQEDYGIPPSHPGARILYFALAVALLAVTVWAGFTSYRTWRYLSAHRALLDAEGVERREFLAIGGVIVAITMGMGILWLALPPLFLDLCWRAR